MARLIEAVGREEHRDIGDYRALHAWSVTEPQAFWSRMWREADFVVAAPPAGVVERLERMPGARWFPGARLNFARNLLRRSGAAAAVVFRNERGARTVWSWDRLRDESRRFAAGLGEAGIGPGDRVAGFLPNVPHAIAAMLGAARIGATWSSTAPEFGVGAALDRLAQIEPAALVYADGYVFKGRTIDVRDKIRRIVERLPGLRARVRIPYPDDEAPTTAVADEIHWEAFGCSSADVFVELPFDHPLYVLFSSGTTGPPKGIVHGAGGTLLQHVKEQRFHCDVRAGDVVFYYTTCGWMMWNWLVSALALGATVVVWDGSPVHPASDTLWSVAAAEGVTHFGASARYYAALEKAGSSPRGSFDLGRLRAVLSTGSPLAPASFDYVYRAIEPDVHLASISGGTDIVSCFVLGNPAGPVWRGEIQAAGLGMRVEVLDSGGRPARGRRGELCCTLAFPSMPLRFWNDPDGSRFRRAYFERFPGVWCHGDWAETTEHGGFVIHGRSDATLNPGGVRIGTAEIYRVVESIPDVAECLAAEQPWNDDCRIVLLVRLAAGRRLDGDVVETIRRRLREEASPRHVPSKILAVADLPRTLSGKLVELAVRDVLAGRTPSNLDAIANPESLDAIARLPGLAED